jgi:hypothetical protein
MKNLHDLHKTLIEIISVHPEYKEGLTDFFIKSQYESYLNNIKEKEGRKLFITGRNVQEIKNQLKKLILISDTIVFNTSDFFTKPTLDFVPFPKGFDSNLIRVIELTETESGKSFIPDAKTIVDAIGILLMDEKLKDHHNTLLGYDNENPNNSYSINNFMLSSSIISDKFNNEVPILVGLTERYSSDLYKLLLEDAEYLFSNGNIVFSPYIRTSSKAEHTLQNIIKADSLNLNYSLYNKDFLSDSIEIDILKNINIPYIENVPIELLSEIIKDEGQALKSFRKQFSRTMEDLQVLDNVDDINRELKYIKRNLFEDELDKVEQLCKKMTKMKTLSSIGAVVTTGVIGLSAYLGLDISGILMAGGGTGLTTANELYKLQNEKQELINSPMYLLWKIKSKK